MFWPQIVGAGQSFPSSSSLRKLQIAPVMVMVIVRSRRAILLFGAIRQE
jgi:hypothetical protein